MTSSGLGGVELFGDAHVGVDLEEGWNVLREGERGRERKREGEGEKEVESEEREEKRGRGREEREGSCRR